MWIGDGEQGNDKGGKTEKGKQMRCVALCASQAGQSCRCSSGLEGGQHSKQLRLQSCSRMGTAQLHGVPNSNHLPLCQVCEWLM